MRTFAVVPALTTAIRFWWSRFGSFITLGGLPLVLYGATYLVLERLPDPMIIPVPWSDVVTYYAIYALGLLIPVPFYVAWHRLTLSLPFETRWRVFPGLGIRDARYGAYTLLTSILVLPGFFASYFPGHLIEIDDDGVLSALLAVGIVVAYMGFCIWIWARLSFLFVGIAVDAFTRFADSWHATKGNVFRLTLLVAALWLALLIIDFFGALLSGGSASRPFAVLIAEAISSFIVGTVWVTAVTFAYREAIGWSGQGVADVFD